MRINHNIAALNTYNKLTANGAQTSKSLEKLSSGLRINKAGDDAAGLAISEKMRGQIRGLDQAARNGQDGISLIQTAEGALNETHSILQRMRELGVQSANDTNTSEDRTNIQSEMDQLTTEIDRIGNNTQFNTKNLLDGSMGGPVSTSVTNISNSSVFNGLLATTEKLIGLKDTAGNSLGIIATDTIEVSYVVNGTTKTSATPVTVDAATDLTALGGELGTDGALSVVGGKLVITAGVAGFNGAVNGMSVTVRDSSGNIRTAATNALSSFTETTAAADKRTNGTATLQIGANASQNVSVDINDMRASALGVNGLKVTTQAQADVALRVIDSAIQKVSAQRSDMGALQNRLEHTINNLGTSSENLTAAESRVRDVDMAKEMMEFTKNNILSQAAQSMLAQANQQPQGVLQLLR